MEKFLDCELTSYEEVVLERIVEDIIRQGRAFPTTDDILHELIRLSEVAIKYIVSK